MNKSFEEIQSFSKDSLEACMVSADVFAKGMQAIAAEVVECSRRAFEKSTEMFERASQTKSLDKAMEVQQTYAKEAYEKFMSDCGKLSGMYMETAKEACKPFESNLVPRGGKSSKANA